MAFGFCTVGFFWFAIGAPRPSFLAICDPDPLRIRAPEYPGQRIYYQHADICRNENRGGLGQTGENIHSGLRAFPSGHAFFLTAPCFWVALYWLARFKLFDGFGHAWKLLVVSIAPAIAIYLSYSRVRDNHHSYWAVTFSILNSIFWVTVVYLMHYDGWLVSRSHVPNHLMWRDVMKKQRADASGPGGHALPPGAFDHHQHPHHIHHPNSIIHPSQNPLYNAGDIVTADGQPVYPTAQTGVNAAMTGNTGSDFVAVEMNDVNRS